jgi:hypothetical protein
VCRSGKISHQNKKDGEFDMNTPLVQVVRLALIEEMELLKGEILKLLEGLSDEQIWRKPVDPGNSIGHLRGQISYLVRLVK